MPRRKKNPIAKFMKNPLKESSRGTKLLFFLGAGLLVVYFISAMRSKRTGETGVGRTEIFPINDDSVSHVQGLAHDFLEAESNHPTVKQLALRILESDGLGTNSLPLDIAKSLQRYVCDEVQFQDDPQGFERMVSPAELSNQILTYGPGQIAVDCDDSSVLLAALLRSVGIQATVAFLDTDGDGAIDHAITVVLLDGQPVYAETTIKGAALGWVPPTTRVQTLVMPKQKEVALHQYGVDESGAPASEIAVDAEDPLQL